MGSGDNTTHYTERMVPEEAHARIFWEHVARYRFAKEFVRGKRVLDIACGEGYGAAGLARAGARSVVGIDVSADVCDHARRKYGLDARAGDAQAIPLPDRSIDVIVSFETIEHVDQPGVFLGECARVLVPDGMLIVSTPNRPVYSGEGQKEPVPSARVRRAGLHRPAPLAVQSRSALHPVPPIGGLLESQVAGSRAIPVASNPGLLAVIVLDLSRDPTLRQSGRSAPVPMRSSWITTDSPRRSSIPTSSGRFDGQPRAALHPGRGGRGRQRRGTTSHGGAPSRPSSLRGERS